MTEFGLAVLLVRSPLESSDLFRPLHSSVLATCTFTCTCSRTLRICQLLSSIPVVPMGCKKTPKKVNLQHKRHCAHSELHHKMISYLFHVCISSPSSFPCEFLANSLTVFLPYNTTYIIVSLVLASMGIPPSRNMTCSSMSRQYTEAWWFSSGK